MRGVPPQFKGHSKAPARPRRQMYDEQITRTVDWMLQQAILLADGSVFRPERRKA